MAGELTVITPENAGLIVQNAPQAYQGNLTSHNKCIEFGKELLGRIKASGMTDALDQEAALFIDRAKKTVRKMNDARSPITKLMDDYRKVFTTMENDIDVTKAGTIPAELQQLRNQYAAKKREEEERRRQEEARRIQIENDKNTFRADCENELSSFYNACINQALNSLTNLFGSITLENFGDYEIRIRDFDTELPKDWNTRFMSSVRLPLTLTKQELSAIRQEITTVQEGKLREQYKFEIENTRDDYINRLPSKKRELEAIAKASAEEAARRKAEIAAREEAEARRREEERKKREEEEKKAKEFAQQSSQMDSLFGASGAETGNHQGDACPAYQPKSSVKLKMNILNIEGYSEVFGLWWTKVGCTMTKEELDKTFKQQITFAEKLANDKVSPIRIQSEHIEYLEEVKAR